MPIDGLITTCLVAEDDLVSADHEAIRDLIVPAFATHGDVFRGQSYRGARPDYRLWLAATDGRLLAHLSLVRRTVAVGEVAVEVMGVGQVATRTDRQGAGLGRRLMTELERRLRTELAVPFGYLGCREPVVGFYERLGWHRLDQPSRFVDPETGHPSGWPGPNLILPIEAPLDHWPHDGVIDLCGLPW